MPITVARFTRAWIETRLAVSQRQLCEVARFTRAWIETSNTTAMTQHDYHVARFTRAWIETSASSLTIAPMFKSRASRARGLKH